MSSKITKRPNDCCGKHPTSDNLGNFRIFRAKARRTVKQNWRTSWCKFVSKCKNSKTNVHHLKDVQDNLTSEDDISNKLGQTFSKHSSTENYYPEFQQF